MVRILFLFCLLLTGCRLGPPYELPPTLTPTEWKAANILADNSPSVDNWWEIFQDELLNQLEEQAIALNPNLYVALARVAEARAVAGVSFSALFPQLNLNPAFTDMGILYKLYGVPANIIPGLKPLVRIHEQQYALPANLSYDVDLWGKYRGQYESAVFNAQAQLEAYWASLLNLTTDLAANYFNVMAMDAQIDLLQETLKLRQETFNFNQSRFKSGLSTLLDVTEAEFQVWTVEAEYADTMRQRGLFENAVAVLLGVPASDFRLAHHPLTSDPPRIPAGMPSTLMLQRPDIAEAERTMASEHALIGVAYASFFPSLQLTGTLGYLSPDFKHFLTWFSRYWQMGANASQFLFDAGRNISNLEATYARFYESEGSYQQVVYNAFREVEDSLTSIEWEAKQYASLQKAVTLAKKTTQLSKNRYKNGLVNFLEVFINQGLELDSERDLVNLLGQRYLATIQLIKALGGAWDQGPFCEDQGVQPDILTVSN